MMKLLEFEKECPVVYCFCHKINLPTEKQYRSFVDTKPTVEIVKKIFIREHVQFDSNVRFGKKKKEKRDENIFEQDILFSPPLIFYFVLEVENS